MTSKKFLKDLETNIQTVKYTIKFSNNAKIEFRQIYDYIFWRLASPINANRFREKVFSKLEILKFNPYIYSSLSFYSSLEYEYRKLPINNYIILYTIIESEKIVRIAHIYYAKSNYKNLL